MPGGKGAYWLFSPSRTVVDNVVGRQKSITIDPQKAKIISARFETSKIDFSIFNVFVGCPIVRFFDNAGIEHVAICATSMKAEIPMDIKVPEGWPKFVTVLSPGGEPVRLLPKQKDYGTNCFVY
jgi:hypothetical protein